jgi:hypothetical protein
MRTVLVMMSVPTAVALQFGARGALGFRFLAALLTKARQSHHKTAKRSTTHALLALFFNRVLVQLIQALGVKLCELGNKVPEVCAPFFDDVGIVKGVQGLVDVVSDLDEAAPGVVELLLLREASGRIVQLLQRFLDRSHFLLALHKKHRSEKAPNVQQRNMRQRKPSALISTTGSQVPMG